MKGCPLLVLRPEPGNADTVARARELGFEPLASPLFDVRPIAWETPPADDFDALLAGSANAFRHGGAGLDALTGLPVYAVGAATSRAAEAAGFRVAATGSGGLAETLPMALSNGARRLLRLSGEERVELSPPEGASIEERIVYATRTIPLAPSLLQHAVSGAVVLLHSAAAAHEFAAQFDTAQLNRNKAQLACLGPRIADAAGAGWAACCAAAEPTDRALLALAGEMCQKARSGVEPQD